MSKNKSSILSFTHNGQEYNSEWKLLQIEQQHKSKEQKVVGKLWRSFTITSGTSSYTLTLSSIVKNKSIYNAVLEIKSNNLPTYFSIDIWNRWRLEGKFLITHLIIEENKHNLLNMKINLESHGEIKNDYTD